MIARSLLVTAVVLPLLCFGCRKATITSYRIPKEKDPEFAAAPGQPADNTNNGGSDMAGATVPTASGDDLAWTAPAAWKEKPATAMRKGSYEVAGGGDFSITAFPGDVGGELANVNRWRGQVQLPPVSESDLPNQVARAEHNGLTFQVVDFTGGSNAQRILGAIVPYSGSTWFFKLIGPAAAVEAAKPDFLKLLESISPARPATNAASASPAPTASAGNAMAGATVPTAQGAGLSWTRPNGWEEKPGSAMRRGSYRVPGESGADGDVSITAFPGDVGGELANVNRWRGQVQLPPLSEGDLPSHVTHADYNGLSFGIVDVTGANGSRILGAFAPYGGATWFFKLTGPEAVVEKAKPAFLELLQTVKPSPTAQ